MPVSVAISGPPRVCWDLQATREVGELVRKTVTERTFGRHLGEDDRPMKPEKGTNRPADLVETGLLSRSLAVIDVRETSAVVGLTGQARVYGPHVDARRPFLGLSPSDGQAIQAALDEICARALSRSAGR